MPSDEAWDVFTKWEKRSKDTVAFRKIYVDMAGGDVMAGLLLSQIVYWFTPAKDGANKTRWYMGSKDDPRRCRSILKLRADWHDEIRLSTRQVDRAMKVLSTDCSLVNVKRVSYHGSQCHSIWINMPNFIASWNKHCDED